MSEWSRVKWSEARQVLRQAGDQPDPAVVPQVAPREWFERLRGEGRDYEAAQFLGLALPRYETVAWAARAVRDLRDPEDRSSPEAEALKAALLWVSDPTEQRRRAAAAAAEKARSDSPERLTALAVFASGGSMAPAEYDPVPAPRELAGLLAGGAVCMAAHKSKDVKAAFATALDAGARMAAGEVEGEPA